MALQLPKEIINLGSGGILLDEESFFLRTTIKKEILEFPHSNCRLNPDETIIDFEGDFFRDNFDLSFINRMFWVNNTGNEISPVQTGGNLRLGPTDGVGFDSAIKGVGSAEIDNVTRIYMEMMVKRESVDAGVNSGIGLTSNPQFFSGEFVYFDFTGAETWTPIVKQGGTTTGTPFTIPDNTWVKVKIIVTAASADFYIDDILKESITANIPTPDALHPLLYAEHGDDGGDIMTLTFKWFMFIVGDTDILP